MIISYLSNLSVSHRLTLIFCAPVLAAWVRTIEPNVVRSRLLTGDLSIGLGYLAGPTIGTLFFKAINGSRNKAMDVMDKR